MTQFLYQKLDSASEMGFLKKEVPACVLDNLNPKFAVRPYQIEAFARFFYYLEGYPNKTLPVHLLFNMATGSGKTLIMAGLILHLYSKGYRNFLFFVNSNNIIEKTKDNFLGKQSSKYLFAEKIIFDGRFVDIQQVDNFEDANPQNINICFTTIQKLHSDLHNEKENAITFEDFKKQKIVLLADEAHHGQATTKQKALSEAMEKPSWENTVEKIFNQDQENLLLEFTATLDFLNKNIVEKYEPKIIYRYDLKEFRNEGYSKDVNILQSDFDEKERILQAIILNQYRQEVAGKHGINLKPVILFKAQKTIAESKENQDKFDTLIETLEEKDIDKVRKKSEVGIIKRAFSFFEENKITSTVLVKKLKSSFAKNKCLNVNEENLDKVSLKIQDKQELITQQHVLNSLEDKNNQIRAIFAVQKLNEGWDVLNLYDIVRLYTARDGDWRNSEYKAGKTTISEAQLIGRGARYFPFIANGEEEKRYMRKFDEDLTNDLRVLEELHYHSVNDVKYITEITKALQKEGLIDEDQVELSLNLKDGFKKTDFYRTGIVYTNKQIKNTYEKVRSFADLGIKKRNYTHLLHSGFGEDKAVFHEGDFELKNQSQITSKDFSLKNIPSHIIRSALARNNFYHFDYLKKHFPHLTSLSDFIENEEFLAGIEVTIKGTAESINTTGNADFFEAIIGLLGVLENEIKQNLTEYQGSEEFYPANVSKVFVDKVLKMQKGNPKSDGQKEFVSSRPWYVFDANYGTSEERKFVEMMDRQMEDFSKEYAEIYLIRNELHFKIYNFKDGQGFAPDFVLFLRQKNGENLTYQVFIEPKGKHLKETDKWKEEFLAEIKAKFSSKTLIFADSKKYRITGVPFYNYDNENEFKEALCASF